MNEDLYLRIYRRLNKKGDVFDLSSNLEISKEVLFAILSQKIVRKTKRDYHGLKRQSSRLLEQWKKGKSLLRLSEERHFAPVLISSFVLREFGITRKEFYEYLRNPEKIGDPRIRKELLEVLAEEVVYSPEAIEIQHKNGKSAEKRISQWLDEKGVSYITEGDVRDLYKKTPDFLLQECFTVDGNAVHWVESKASFGDKIQMKGDYHRQLKYYVDLFGRGLVIYWHGYLNDSACVQDFNYDSQILIANSGIIEGDNV
ncbi:MAG: TPD domain-containing protein [Theionarchaea archaeon]|nr:TPD domain-containing protein [Theionarchaea archaeon]MBU7036632.1 TPD domain-containing protein [Theionarchaea archaeon]